MVYDPIVTGLMDFNNIGPNSAGYSVLGNKTQLRYGMLGLTGFHENGQINLTPCIGGSIKRTSNYFDVSLFVNQYPVANSDAWGWTIGTKQERERVFDWTKTGLKPTFDRIRKDVDILLPNLDDKKFPNVKAALMRSQVDIQSYATVDMTKDVLLGAFMTYPNVTSASYDCFFMPTFHNGPIPLRCNIDTLSNQADLQVAPTTEGAIKFNGRYEIDLQPGDPKIERFIASQRQNKSMWNFIEDYFGIHRNWAPLDFLYLAGQFAAVRDYGQFVFDQIISFDQRPFVSGLDFKHYVAMQLLRCLAFKYINTRCPPDQWVVKTKVLLRHPGISDNEFEDVMKVYDRYWSVGSFERSGEVGNIDLDVFPVGNDTVKVRGFNHSVPALNISEIPVIETQNQNKDFATLADIKEMNFAKPLRIFAVKEAPRVVTWDRLFGYDGIIDEKASAISIGVITPTSVKQLVPYLNVNDGSFDRFDKSYWPLLIQQKADSNELEVRCFGKPLEDSMKDDIVRYAVGLNSIFKGNLFGVNLGAISGGKEMIGSDSSAEARLSMWRPRTPTKVEPTDT